MEHHPLGRMDGSQDEKLILMTEHPSEECTEDTIKLSKQAIYARIKNKKNTIKLDQLPKDTQVEKGINTLQFNKQDAYVQVGSNAQTIKQGQLPENPQIETTIKLSEQALHAQIESNADTLKISEQALHAQIESNAQTIKISRRAAMSGYPPVPRSWSVVQQIGHTAIRLLARLLLLLLVLSRSVEQGGKHLTADVIVKMQEPDPERLSRMQQVKAKHWQDNTLGWLPALSCINACGILLGAYACAASIQTNSDQDVYLWLALFVIFGPACFRLLSPLASRFERIGILCLVGISTYILIIQLSPLHFVFIDEYLHLKTLTNIMNSGHLFQANSLLPISPVYPALEIVTDAVSTISGIDPGIAGLIVVAIARLFMLLALFLLYEHIACSARIAALATLFYMTNMGFMFFNAMFVYETLGLALGAFVLFALVRANDSTTGKTWLYLIAWSALGALATTHHVSDFFFVGLLVLWAIIQRLLRQPMMRSYVAAAALIGIVLAMLWVLIFARSVISYLTDPLLSALANLLTVLAGANHARKLFVDAVGGHPTPRWEQILMLLAMALTMLAIPLGVVCIWKRYRKQSSALLFGLVTLLYPLSQGFRLASDPEGIAERSTPFIFIAVGFALAIFVAQIWPVYTLTRIHSLLLSAMASIVFVGGAMLGAGPTWAIMPGSFIVGGDARSFTPENIEAATWMSAKLGPNNRVFADRSNRLLLGTFGNQVMVTAPEDKVYLSAVMFAHQNAPWESALLQSVHVHYLVVDLRLSTALPIDGFYFDESEPESQNLTKAISRQALTKFNSMPGVTRIFDSGNIIIYDVGEAGNALKTP